MDEVRTSEELEKEVLEDARKKAERTLLGADKKIDEIRREGEEKIREELASLAEEYGRRKELEEKKLLASLPLDKGRRRLAFLERRLEETLSAFFSSLGEEEVLDLLSRRGARAAGLIGSPPHEVYFSGVSREGAVKAAASLGVQNAEFKPAEGYRGLVFLNTHEGIRYRLTLDEVAGELRERGRRRIVDALFGGKF
mgnify:CR=1 FL=1